MRRKIVSVTAVVSLVLCVATAGLWVRSHWVSDTLGLFSLSSISTDRGEIVVGVAEPDSNFSMDTGYHRDQLPDPDEPWNPRRVAERTWTVFFAHGERFPGLHLVVIRFWAVFVAAASPLLFMALGGVRRRRRVARGLCSACGYDLRATPDRCPECAYLAKRGDRGPSQ
jgi:hypothetical protein